MSKEQDSAITEMRINALQVASSATSIVLCTAAGFIIGRYIGDNTASPRLTGILLSGIPLSGALISWTRNFSYEIDVILADRPHNIGRYDLSERICWYLRTQTLMFSYLYAASGLIAGTLIKT